MLPAPAPDPGAGLFSYALTEDRWVVGGAVSNGAHVVRWAATALSPGTGVTDEELLAEAAGVPAGSDGLVMLPYLLSERAPRWRPDLAGAFLCMRREHTRGHLVRAEVEGVCRQLAGVVHRLDGVAPVTCVRATGGAFRAPLWRTTLPAALDRPLVVGADGEGTALGAAALGVHALGRSGGLEEALAQLQGTTSAEEQVVVPGEHGVAAMAGLADRTRLLAAALQL